MTYYLRSHTLHNSHIHILKPYSYHTHIQTHSHTPYSFITYHTGIQTPTSIIMYHTTYLPHIHIILTYHTHIPHSHTISYPNSISISYSHTTLTHHIHIIPTHWHPTGNHFYENAAVGGFAGFWYAMPEYPLGPSAPSTLRYSDFLRYQPMGDFINNKAHSNNFGLFVDEGQTDVLGNTKLTAFTPRYDIAATLSTYCCHIVITVYGMYVRCVWICGVWVCVSMWVCEWEYVMCGHVWVCVNWNVNMSMWCVSMYEYVSMCVWIGMWIWWVCDVWVYISMWCVSMYKYAMCNTLQKLDVISVMDAESKWIIINGWMGPPTVGEFPACYLLEFHRI